MELMIGIEGSFSFVKLCGVVENFRHALQASNESVTANYTGPVAIFINFHPNLARLSSRATADVHQPPFRATAAVCRRPLGRRADPNGRKLTILERFWHPKLSGQL